MSRADSLSQNEPGQEQEPDQSRQQALASILHNPAVWRAQRMAQDGRAGLSTGHAAFDRVLPDGGWPAAALTELLTASPGLGEVSVLLPALRALGAEGRGLALLAPPHLPQACAWAAAGVPLERLLIIDSAGVDMLWAAEQLLRSGECGALLLWGQAAGRALNYRALQRLQLAAATGHTACFLYRSPQVQSEASPAPLRLRLRAQEGVLQVQVLKCRGAGQGVGISLPVFPEHWQAASAPAASVLAAATAAPVLQPLAETLPFPAVARTA